MTSVLGHCGSWVETGLSQVTGRASCSRFDRWTAHHAMLIVTAHTKMRHSARPAWMNTFPAGSDLCNAAFVTHREAVEFRVQAWCDKYLYYCLRVHCSSEGSNPIPTRISPHFTVATVRRVDTLRFLRLLLALGKETRAAWGTKCEKDRPVEGGRGGAGPQKGGWKTERL